MVRIESGLGNTPGKFVPLNLYADCQQGKWTPVIGDALRFNKALHEGEVTHSDYDGQKLKLTVHMTISPDPWIKGGPAEYVLELQRKEDRLEGAATGWLVRPSGKIEIESAVTGVVMPLVPIAAKFKPVAPAEHPRLLFRKDELPDLRKKIQTPFGQAILQRLKASSEPVALGMLYQLTGDKEFANRAFPATLQVVANRNGGAFALGRFWGDRTQVVAMTYDLCYEAWDASQRGEVQDYLDWILFKCLHRQHRVGTVNWQPGSNYTVIIYGGNGLAAMALAGEKSAGPYEPVAPRTQVLDVAPWPEAIAAGVPVVRLESGVMSKDWLWLGPYQQRVYQHVFPFSDYKDHADLLAEAGGMDKVRPKPGDKVTFQSQTQSWRPLPPDGITKDGQLNASLLSGNHENRYLFFYTVLDVAEPGLFRVAAKYYDPAIFIAGQRDAR